MDQHWTAEQNNNFLGARLSGWIIRYDPSPNGTKHADGSTTFSLNFPALALTDIVGNPETIAPELAAKLNSHEPLLSAAKLANEALADPAIFSAFPVGAARIALADAISKAEGH